VNASRVVLVMDMRSHDEEAPEPYVLLGVGPE
jgi:hypothetical protein